MHKKYVSYISGRLSVLSFLIGAIGNGIGFLLISYFDKLFARMAFYVKQGYVGSAGIYVLEPPDVLGVLSQQIGISLIAGCLAMSGVMIYVMLSLLTRLDSESTLGDMGLNPYNAPPLRRVTELLTSFWVMTSSGLLIFPLLTVIGSNLADQGRPTLAAVQFTLAYVYPIFLVPCFVLSSALVKVFISTLKTRAAEKVSSEMQHAEKSGEGIDALVSKLCLIDRVAEGPAGVVLMQLFQVGVTLLPQLLGRFH